MMQGMAVAFQIFAKLVVAVVLGMFWVLGYVIQSLRDAKAEKKNDQQTKK
jgi:hypothetical protein